jgi:replicative DNA helicase
LNTAEAAFYAHLTDTDSLDYMVQEGFTLDTVREVIPTELGRKITSWAIDYYFENGRMVAPSKEAIMAEWEDKMGPLGLTINDEVEVDSVQWAISNLRELYADVKAGEFAIEISNAVRMADGPDRVKVVLEYSQKLHILSQALITRKNEMTGSEGLSDALKRYDERVRNGQVYDGITFGIPEIDDFIMGVHAGEMAVVAATSGGGKSWLSIVVLLSEFDRGRRCILFTLENSVPMTFDRIACVKCHVDYEEWQRGECSEGDVLRVKEFLTIMENSPVQPIIVQPDTTEATGAAMVRRAIIEECDSIVIDQLSHIEPVAGSTARQRNEIVAEIVKDLYKLINQSGTKIPLLLLHQINRKGREEARKNGGQYVMDHMGEATQVENAADLVLAIYQGPDHEINGEAELQLLKGRRLRPIKGWRISWRPALGDVRFRGVLEND